jgi:FKBP-type peptidyl-prolyl cis-trans isomerase FkpA
MRKTIYLLFLLVSAGLVSCRKDKVEQNIKEYDDAQIKAYISANGLTNMQRDVTGGDTSGIYYEILGAGTGAPVDESTPLSLTLSVKTLDNSYSVQDTIVNHQYIYPGQAGPAGFQLALRNLVKRQGTRLRVIIPSHLAYGQSGGLIGSTRIGGNKSLDFYLNAVNNVSSANGVSYPNNMAAYDDISIQKYMAANNLTGYTPVTITEAGPYLGRKYYYKLRTPGTGTDVVTANSVVNINYRTTMLNGTIVEPSGYTETNNSVNGNYYMNNNATGAQVEGVRQALFKAGLTGTGTEFSVILPSGLAYGLNSYTSYPAHTCIAYDVSIATVTN